jgi:hypothetical protein
LIDLTFIAIRCSGFWNRNRNAARARQVPHRREQTVGRLAADVHDVHAPADSIRMPVIRVALRAVQCDEAVRFHHADERLMPGRLGDDVKVESQAG